MTPTMLNLFSQLTAKLPLPIIHKLGKALGWLIHLRSTASAHTLRQNLTQSNLCADQARFKQLVHANIAETGKAILETLAIWQWPQEKTLSLVKSCHNWYLVEEALARGKGIIFLTPHLGCFEITSIYYEMCIRDSPWTG